MIVIFINEQRQASLKWLKNNYGNLIEYKRKIPAFKIVPTTKIKTIMLKSQANVIEGYEEVENFMAGQFNMLGRPSPSIHANSSEIMPRPREEGEDDMQYADLPGDIMQKANTQPQSNFGNNPTNTGGDNPPPVPKPSMSSNSKQEFNPASRIGAIASIVVKPSKTGAKSNVDERSSLSGSVGVTPGVRRSSGGVGTGSNLGGGF